MKIKTVMIIDNAVSLKSRTGGTTPATRQPEQIAKPIRNNENEPIIPIASALSKSNPQPLIVYASAPFNGNPQPLILQNSQHFRTAAVTEKMRTPQIAPEYARQMISRDFPGMTTS
jgi:hypothetical protein